jgi:proteasome lid subunit RPN8/RPN11
LAASSEIFPAGSIGGLWIDADGCRSVVELAIASYPHECCGLLVGRRGLPSGAGDRTTENRTIDDRTVLEVVALNNAWEPSLLGYTDPAGGSAHSDRDRYWIDPAGMLAVQRSARERGLEILGVYHSHPDHPAVPSECDRRLAWPVYSYLIVSVVKGEVLDLQSWRLNDDHRFEPEPVKMIGTSANKAPFLS